MPETNSLTFIEAKVTSERSGNWLIVISFVELAQYSLQQFDYFYRLKLKLTFLRGNFTDQQNLS